MVISYVILKFYRLFYQQFNEMNYKYNIPEYNVSQLNKSIKEVIESNFNYIRIRGEISEIKTATRGQLYFLQDDDYFKPLTQLLYKAKNGRILNDNG